MPTLKRQLENGKSIEFKAIGAEIVPTERLHDFWAKIPAPPTVTPDEEKVLRMLEQRLSYAKERHMKRIDIYNENYLQYRSINFYNKLYGSYPSYWNMWGVNIFIPKTFEAVEGMRADLKRRSPDFSVKPGPGTPDADKMNIMAHGEWERSDSNKEALEALDDAIIWGRGTLRTDLVIDRKDEHALSFDAQGKLVYTPGKVTKYYGAASRHVDPYDVLPEPNPAIANYEQMHWCFVRHLDHVEDVRNHFKALHEAGVTGITDAYTYLKPGGDLNDYKYLRTYMDDIYRISGLNERYPATTNQISVHASINLEQGYKDGLIEWFEYFEKDRWIVFSQALILRDTPNPLPHKELPLRGMTLFDAKTFHGPGLPEVMRWLQVIENVLTEEGLNNIVMNVHRMFAVNSRALQDEDELKVRPFGIVHLKPLPNLKVQDAIQPIPFPPIGQDYFEFLQINRQNIQTATGSSEFNTGGVTKEAKVERATVANLISRGSGIRLNEIARRFEQNLIQPAVEQLVAIIQFYYKTDLGGLNKLDVPFTQDGQTQYHTFLPKDAADLTPQDIEGLGENIITLDQIQGHMKVEVKGGTRLVLEPQEEQQLKMDFVQWANQLVRVTGVGPDGKPVGEPIFDVTPMAIKVAEEVFQIPDAEKLLAKKQTPPNAPGLPGPLTTPSVDNMLAMASQAGPGGQPGTPPTGPPQPLPPPAGK